MALGLLLIAFIVMIVISVLGTIFLFLTKNQKVKNVLFYILAVWGMLISYLSATSMATNFIAEQAIAWTVGFLSVLAIILKVKKPEWTKIAHVMVGFSAIYGVIDIFFI